MRFGTRAGVLSTALLLAGAALIWSQVVPATGHAAVSVHQGSARGVLVASAGDPEGEGKEMEWFKETMEIAPKYQERNQGVLGMTWAHFILMVFLVIFFISATVNYYARSKRTKQILNTLLEKEESGGT
jgi:hypothetical protein